MKQIFTLIAIMFSVSSFAAAPFPKTSRISISNSNRTETRVRIDGAVYNLDNTFVLDNIRTGKHSISIIQVDKFGFRKIQKTIYSSTMSVAPGQTINININRNGQVAVKTSAGSMFGHNDHNDHYNNKGYNDNKNYNDHDNRNNNYGRH